MNSFVFSVMFIALLAVAIALVLLRPLKFVNNIFENLKYQDIVANFFRDLLRPD